MFDHVSPLSSNVPPLPLLWCFEWYTSICFPTPPLPSSIGSKHWQYAPPPVSVSSWLVEIALLTYNRVAHTLVSYQSLRLCSWPLSDALDFAVTFYFSLFSERLHKKGWCPFCIKKICRSKQSLSESPGVRPQQQGEAREDCRTRPKKWQNVISNLTKCNGFNCAAQHNIHLGALPSFTTWVQSKLYLAARSELIG